MIINIITWRVRMNMLMSMPELYELGLVMSTTASEPVSFSYPKVAPV